jgi:hypothetical protein
MIFIFTLAGDLYFLLLMMESFSAYLLSYPRILLISVRHARKYLYPKRTPVSCNRVFLAKIFLVTAARLGLSLALTTRARSDSYLKTAERAHDK